MDTKGLCPLPLQKMPCGTIHDLARECSGRVENRSGREPGAGARGGLPTTRRLASGAESRVQRVMTAAETPRPAPPWPPCVGPAPTRDPRTPASRADHAGGVRPSRDGAGRAGLSRGSRGRRVGAQGRSGRPSGPGD